MTARRTGMKLVVLAVVMLFGGVAHAEGPRPRGELRQLLLQHFDRNHDGRLEGRERKQAARALRRVAKQLAKGDRHHQARRPQRDQQIDIRVETDDLR